MAKRVSAYSKALQEAQQQNRPEPENKTTKHSTVQTSEHPASPTPKQRIKATFYLTPEAIAAIDTEQIKRFLATNKKPEKSDLVTEAVLTQFKRLE
jgi:hypothetical protein